jgi:hypothetical protein
VNGEGEAAISEGVSPHDFRDVGPIYRAPVRGEWESYNETHTLAVESVVSLKTDTISARVIFQNNAFEVFRSGFIRSDKNKT